MKVHHYAILLLIFTLLLSACSAIGMKNTKGSITVTPYEVSEKEQILLSKSGAGSVSFFELNGQLDEGDDLQFWIEAYKDGEFQEVIGKSWNEVEEEFSDTIISFAVTGAHEDDEPMKLISGIPTGTFTLNYELEVSASSFGNLIGTSITLEKDQPAYLAAFTGSTDGSLRGIASVNGELPENIEEVEYALLYTILWTDKESRE